MGHCNQFPATLNWQPTSPTINFLPRPANNTGSVPSGSVNGAMASTNTIYSNILEKSRLQNLNAEVAWTGTPTGTITVWTSNSGINWNSITFNPALAQPSGSAGGYSINFTQLSAKYIYFQYVNASGTGTLNIYLQFQDLN